MTKNNVLILTDIEGISEVSSIEAINQNHPAYFEACEKLMEDTNVAISALLDSGAEKIYVIDGHGKGDNFIKEKLNTAAHQITISELSDVIKKVECVVLIGMHAMSGTACAFLDHTQSSVKIHHYFYGDNRIGEISQIGTFAGHFGVPCVAVTGDDAACQEAKSLIDGIFTAPIKRAKGRNFADCLSSDDAAKHIYSAVRGGYIARGDIKPMSVTLPLRITVEFNRSDYCDEACENDPQIIRTDAFTATTIKEKIENYQDVLL